MPSSDPVIVARNRLAAAHMVKRGTSPDPAAVADARRDLTTAILARTITERLAASPPLYPEQRALLTALIYGGEQ